MIFRAPRLSATARRAQLIDVGRAVFARRGFEGASLEEIAEKAKVSRPVLYEHFGGKEGLYAVIIDREMEYLVRRISESIGGGTPRERVEAAAFAFFSYVKDHPDGFAILTHDAPVTTASGDVARRSVTSGHAHKSRPATPTAGAMPARSCHPHRP